jgi:hypothetical protein
MSRPITAIDVIDRAAEQEIIIDVNPEWGWVRYEGTAAQLIAEGLVPQGLEWPRAASYKRWSAGGFDYRLRRTRPEGHRGPMRSWLEIDNWSVRVTVMGRDQRSLTLFSLERRADELRAAFHRETPEGRREWDAFVNRSWAARQDKAFQNFKAIFAPERRKPGRKPKNRSGEATI